MSFGSRGRALISHVHDAGSAAMKAENGRGTPDPQALLMNDFSSFPTCHLRSAFT